MPRGVEIRPGFEARIALLGRHAVEFPLPVARLRIERLQESGLVEIVAGADDNMIADDDRRGRRKILQIEIGQLLVPDLLAGLGVETNQEVVGRFHEEAVVPHAESAVADVRAAARLPHEMPDLVAVESVHGPRVVGRGYIEDAVDLENRALHVGERAGFERSHAAHDETGPRAAALRPGHQTRAPGERQTPDVRLVELREAAVSFARIVARVSGPVAGGAEFLEQLGRIEALSVERYRREQERQ